MKNKTLNIILFLSFITVLFVLIYSIYRSQVDLNVINNELQEVASKTAGQESILNDKF